MMKGFFNGLVSARMMELEGERVDGRVMAKKSNRRAK